MRILFENGKRKKRREDKPHKGREILEAEIKCIFKKIGKPQRKREVLTLKNTGQIFTNNFTDLPNIRNGVLSLD